MFLTFYLRVIRLSFGYADAEKLLNFMMFLLYSKQCWPEN
jgi:hypothetical protein